MEENTPPAYNALPPVAPPPVAPPPPLPPPPPVLIPPSPTPPPRRGRGWMVFAIILLVLLLISFLYNLGNFASNIVRGGGRSSRFASRTAGPRLEEVVVEDNDASDKIAVIEVEGIITGRQLDQGGYNMVDVIKAQLKKAQDDDKVKAVILKVDSPGGEVLASDEIYRAIERFQNESNKKPVIASMGSLAASGGYYVSSPCRWIVANEMTITGSIGVIMSTYNYRGLMDKVGLVPQTYKSGKFKDMLSGSRELDKIPPEEREMVQGLIDETYHKFRSVVQNGRGQAYDKNRNGKDKGRQLSENWTDFADGRVLSGTEAFKLGFVDELGTFEDATRRAKLLAGMPSSANLIEYQQRYDLSDFFKMFGQTDSKVIKVDIGMEMPKLQAGQLYFLSPTFMH